MRPDRAAMMAADAGESSQVREIAAVITRLPVEPGVTRMAAGDWVMDPGEMETEGEETMAEVAARLLGQTTSFTSLDLKKHKTPTMRNHNLFHWLRQRTVCLVSYSLWEITLAFFQRRILAI